MMEDASIVSINKIKMVLNTASSKMIIVTKIVSDYRDPDSWFECGV